MSRSVLMFAVAVVALCGTASCDDAAGGYQPSPAGTAAAVVVRKPRSALQACRRDVAELCSKRKDALKCLENNSEKIVDATCSEWIAARKVCLAAISSAATCKTPKAPILCFRSVLESELPEDCTKTDFYKAMALAASRKRVRPPPTH